MSFAHHFCHYDLSARGWSALVWASLSAPLVLWHERFCNHSLAHVFGAPPLHDHRHQPQQLLLSLLTLGEGWHNNHHYYMASVRQGFRLVGDRYHLLHPSIPFLATIVRELRMPPRALSTPHQGAA